MATATSDELELFQLPETSAPLGKALRSYTLRCWGCARRAIARTLDEARDGGWRRKRGKWTCPTCSRNPLNAAAVDHQQLRLFADD